MSLEELDGLSGLVSQTLLWDAPLAWARRWFPRVFTLPFGAHHEWLLTRLGAKPRGYRGFAGAARGSGKTVTALLALPLMALARGSHRFVVVVAQNQTEADARLEMLARALEANEELQREFPSLRLIRALQSHVELAGGRILAAGAGVSVRGMIRALGDENARPDLFLFDDLETPEQARSKLRTDRLEEWLMADVSQMGGPGVGHSLDVLGIGTTLETDALATRMLKRRGRFAGWDVAEFPAMRNVDGNRVATWPAGQPIERLLELLTPGSETFVGIHTFAKEYLLDPMDREDAPIKRAYLQHAPVPEGLRYVSLGIDPATGEKDVRDQDYSALVKVGMDPDGRIWVVEARRGWWTQQTLWSKVEELSLRTDDRGNPEQVATVAFEGIGGFAWGVGELRRRGIAHRAIRHLTGDKLERLQPVALRYEQMDVWHAPHLEGGEFEGELLSFPGGDHDDYVDALVHGVKLATNDFRRQRFKTKEDERG